MWLRSEVGVSAIALAPILLDLPPLFLRYAARDRHQVRRRPASGGNRASVSRPCAMRLIGGIIGHVGSSAPYRSHTLRLFAVFGGYHGLGRSAGEVVERQAPSPGKIAVARAPRREPPGGPLDGRCERVGPPRWADGIPGGPPLACARAWRSTQAAADSDSPLHPVVPARDPPRRPPVRRARIYASSRQRGCAPGLGLRRDGWGA